MSEELLAFNGVNGATGEYGLPPMTNKTLVDQIIDRATYEGLKDEPEKSLRIRRLDIQRALSGTISDAERAKLEKELQAVEAKLIELGYHLAVVERVDPTNLAQTGWGIIFAQDADPAVKEALSDLLKLRQEQAGDLFRVYEGPKEGFRPSDTKNTFLGRNGFTTSGPVVPEKGPYYLMIVGSPEKIPYIFQYQLDVQYAVGRIYFDTLQEYANYASSVVAAEKRQFQLPRKLALFGVANPDDRSTQLSQANLTRPLLKMIQERKDWKMNAYLNEQATKAQLQQLVGGEQTPAFLFTTSHGMEFPMDDKRQIPHQGALLCQDWPGPNAWRGEIPPEFYFSGDDIATDDHLSGLITFHFACYGVGTPQYDEFSQQAGNKNRKSIAPRPFLASLPRKMLGHPKGGALAVIGHVERAWGYSFLATSKGKERSEIGTFESTITRILDGKPLGLATEYFNQRYAELGSDLSVQLEEIENDAKYDPYLVASLWTANNDARSYVILGDPAVRLAVVASNQAATGRVEIKAQTISVSSAAPTPAVASLKPAVISDEDWARTPDSVKSYIRDLEAKQSKS
jgi:hypothetical protein